MNWNTGYVLKKLQKICSRQEKCTHDIIEYLNKAGIPESFHKEIINKLKTDKYIDEKRYAQAAVHDKFKLNKWGKLKIRNFLIQKHIEEENIDDALSLIDQTQYEHIIRQELRKKGLTLHVKNPEDREQKIMQFAASRGYEEEIVRKWITHL